MTDILTFNIILDDIDTVTLEYINNIDYEYDEYGNPVGPIEISKTTISDTAEVHT